MIVTKLDVRTCDRCGIEFKFSIGSIHAITAETKRSLLATVYEPDYEMYSLENEIDLCPLCAEAFRAFMDEMKPDPAADLPDDPMELLENWLDDQSDMMDDILEGMDI